MTETPDVPKLKEHILDYLASTFQNCQCHSKQENSGVQARAQRGGHCVACGLPQIPYDSLSAEPGMSPKYHQAWPLKRFPPPILNHQILEKRETWVTITDPKKLEIPDSVGLGWILKQRNRTLGKIIGEILVKCIINKIFLSSCKAAERDWAVSSSRVPQVLLRPCCAGGQTRPGHHVPNSCVKAPAEKMFQCW